MKICELSVKRPVAVTMIVLIFVVLGLYSLSMLPMEMMPEIDLSMAVVYTQYRNVGPEEVENLVTKPIESAVSSVSGIEGITSQTSEGSSFVMLEFASGTDMDKAIGDIESSLNMISAYLPENAEEPMVMKLDVSSMPIFMTSVSYEGYDVIQTKQYIEDNIKSKLEAIDGVASVSVMGAETRQIDVVIDPEKVFGYGVSLSDVAGSIAAQNTNLPAGSTEGMNKNLAVRTVGKFENVKEIESVPIMTPTGQIIHIRDIATVDDTYSEESSYARLNRENAISISITKESDANTVDVVGKINKVLEDAKKNALKFGYNVVMEQASYIEDSISSVASNAVTGGILAILILILFLGSVKTSLVIGISMPISVITTFVVMYFSNITLNVVSLGGLALGVGMLVDNAVVVLENIFRRKNVLKEDSKTAAIVGASEVASAVFASVITTCIVYVPILFIDNMMAVMFKQLAFAIIFSQAASIATTFLLVPMLSSRIKKEKTEIKWLKKILVPVESTLNKMYGFYERTLAWVLGHKKKFIVSVLGVFAVCMVVLSLIGMTLMPATDEGTFTVSVTLPEGSLLEDTNEITTKIENVLMENEYVDTVFTRVGSGGMSAVTGGTTSNAASITVTLNDKRNKATADVVEEVRAELSDISGAEITLAASSSSMMMASDEVSFEFTGSDDEALEEYVLRAEEILASIDGVTETETSISDKKSEVRITIDKDKASNYGLTTATATSLISQLTTETTASRYLEKGSEYDIVVKYPKDYVENYNDLKTMQIKTPLGQWVSIGDIAEIAIEDGATTLNRVNQKRTLTLSGKLYGKDMGRAKVEFEKELAALPVPDGVGRTASGAYEVMMDAMKSLLLAIVLGILFMYMVMAAQFENFVHPFIILFTIPLSMIGVVLSLVIAGEPLSVVGCIGILMLGGIIVNNAIVLIDFINTSKVENSEANLREHIMNAGITRLRPILMTSLTSILGFLPMAISTASGSEMMKPLATVLLGGLTVGTVLTLYFIPAVYMVIETRLEKRRAKKA